MSRNKEMPWKVDGVAIPTPSSYTFGEEDLSSKKSGRTLDGVMHKDVVSIKQYYDCSWKCLSWEDAAILLKAVRGKQKVKFTHADPEYPRMWVEGDFYIGKRAAGALNLKDSNYNWVDISMQFTEI